MPHFEQVLSPAPDGQGMILDKKLQRILSAETAQNHPVVVLAVVGPRDFSKSALLSAVQRTLSAGSDTPLAGIKPTTHLASMTSTEILAGMELQETPDAMESWTPAAGMDSGRPHAAPEDAAHSAGAAAWSELLPVSLPSGESAVLLLLDSWGPLDPGCPEWQRASVLLFSALVSSTLVVQISAAGLTRPLDDLKLLAELGAKALDVQHCSPLQELVLLMSDWGGPGPCGRQADFRPLYNWAQSESAARALAMMGEATNWYNEGNAFVFLTPNRAAMTTSSDDPVALLAAPRAAKRFHTADVRAGELTDYLGHLATALAAAPRDAVALLLALAEANQSVAARAARPVYKRKLEQLMSQTQMGTTLEYQLQVAHNRAAHDARMAFMLAEKMSHESLSSNNALSELDRWLEEEYENKRKAIVTDTEKLEKEVLHQRRHCQEAYKANMQNALKEFPWMSMAELIKNHERCKTEALSAFTPNTLSQPHNQQYMEMSDDLEVLFRKFSSELGQAKGEAEVARQERSLISIAVKSAERLYGDIMRAVKPDQLSLVHAQVLECAKLHFEAKTKDFSDEQKPEARKGLEKVINETLQGLLRQSQRNLGTTPSATWDADMRVPMRGRAGPRPTSWQEPRDRERKQRAPTQTERGFWGGKWFPRWGLS